MSTVHIEDAQAHLQQIISGLNPGEPLTITKDGEPVARLTHAPLKSGAVQSGHGQGYFALDGAGFRCALEDFRDYME